MRYIVACIVVLCCLVNVYGFSETPVCWTADVYADPVLCYNSAGNWVLSSTGYNKRILLLPVECQGYLMWQQWSDYGEVDWSFRNDLTTMKLTGTTVQLAIPAEGNQITVRCMNSGMMLVEYFEGAKTFDGDYTSMRFYNNLTGEVNCGMDGHYPQFWGSGGHIDITPYSKQDIADGGFFGTMDWIDVNIPSISSSTIRNFVDYSVKNIGNNPICTGMFCEGWLGEELFDTNECGDYNGDGLVNMVDFSIWAARWSDGDFNDIVFYAYMR